ncbi:uncharacterized protein L201_003149 [Kwoniella dendrophila CBS 6074]|uniref:histidine kinase n=1 Tax=Kwoniella dendrophila CBS 6074 TaxID=1295534 RepID=A0AAX4JUQ2_9TREE
MSSSDPKGKGKATEVKTIDFAHPDHLSKGKIREPQTQEEWHDFVTRYSLGEYNNCNFADDALPSPPKPIRYPSDETHGTTDTGSTNLTSTVVPSANRPSRQSPPIYSRHNSNNFDGGDEPNDFHPDTSYAGPSNQDPDIPNIDQSNSANAESSTSARRHPKKVEEKVYKDQESMTTENIRQLGLEQQDDRVRERKAAEVSQEDGGSRTKRKGKPRRRHRDHAELASVGRSMSVDSSEDEDPAKMRSTRRRAPRQPRSRGSWSLRSKSPSGSLLRRGTGPTLDQALFESGTNDSTSVSAVDVAFDQGKERERITNFFEKHGYMPAPKQPPEATRRRLRVIRRLGLEDIDPFHRETLDRFTRLATSVFRTRSALISVIGRDRQIFLSEIGMGMTWTDLDVSFCCHSLMSPGSEEHCMVVPDAGKDWRFKKNPLVKEGTGPVQFYAGAPLRVGSGNKSTIIGSLCVLDDNPRDFSVDDRKLLSDLADCVVSELELIYSQQASIESAKLHQISVDFLRRSLKHRPQETAGQSKKSGTGTGTGTGGTDKVTDTSSASSVTGKRISGADQNQDQVNIDIYDEACREVRYALDAYAVAVVDLSQFHLFYPTYQNSSTGGGSSTRGGSTTGNNKSQNTGTTGQSSFTGGRTGSTSSSTARGNAGEDDQEAYTKPINVKRALPTYAITDPLAPSRTPQVLYIPSRRKSDPNARYSFTDNSNSNTDNLAVLGYSCSEDGFAFNFTSSPAARKIISDFIASNVKTRKVWYTRDDNEGIAQSITHLMPPGTETSMAMPVFGFDGQVAFAVVACWTDPLYTYPAGAMQFVETIAGSLLASVMKERLHRAERAQLNFAAAASHELRTPLHQINAAASLLRMALHGVLEHEGDTMPKVSREDRIEALAQLEIIEANGLSLGGILENIIDTLDIGKMASKVEQVQTNADGTAIPPDLLRPRGSANITDFAEVLENVVDDAMRVEAKTKRIATGTGLENVEVILEVLPRNRGTWKMSSDSGPLARALGKIVHNAVKFTDKGHVHITVQDISRDVVLPGGYDNSIKLSTVSIDIKDTGRGMSSEFLEREVLRPFAKEDSFTPGSGLGLGLAQRMIELLGGKLAIASTLGKGTLVHIELPVHLLNDDNDSDQDVMASGNETSSEAGTTHEPVRQDGIFLVGWAESKSPSLRRVGKSLARQLKLHFCRIVTEINYASLIVLPEGVVSEIKLAELCRLARPSVQLIIIGKDHSIGALAPALGPATSTEYNNALGVLNDINLEGEKHGYSHGHHHHGHHSSNGHSRENTETPKTKSAVEYLKTIPTIHLTRPLRPSLIRRIMQPAVTPQPLREIYKSDVVGGDEAKEEAEAENASINASTVNGVEKLDKAEIAKAKDNANHDTQDLLSSDLDEPVEITSSRRSSLPPFTNTTGPHSLSPKSSSTTLRRLSSYQDRKHLNHQDKKGELTGESSESTSNSAISGIGGANTDSSMTSEGGYQASIASDSSALSEASESSSLALPPRLREERIGSDHTIKGLDNQTPDESPLKVLVVEDNAVNRKILTTMLKRTSCQFAEAADGVEAVDQFNAFHPDLVLLDITMPRKDGFAAASEMRHLEATLPADSTVPLEEVMKVLAVSSEDQSSDTPTPQNTTQDEVPPTSPSPVLTPSSSAEPLSPTGSVSGFGSGNRRAKIIAVTAMSAEHQRRKGLIESGIDMWMVKPIAMRELKSIIEQMKEEKAGWYTNSSHNSVSGGSDFATTGGRSDTGSSKLSSRR